MRDIVSTPIIAVATFENQTVNVRIPFEISSKSMENHDISWSEVHGFIDFKEHMWNNVGNRMKKTIKQSSVLKEKSRRFSSIVKTQCLWWTLFKRHRCSAFHRILVTASGAETAMATKKNELKFSALWAAIHSTAKRRITTVDYFFRYFPSHKIWDEEYI